MQSTHAGDNPLIEAENLTKRFGETTAVDGLTLSVAEGEVFGFLGPNGAGKTTTVRMLSCLISKTSGEARIGGHDTGRAEERAKIRQMIGVLPESAGLYDDLSPYKNLRYYARLYGLTESRTGERIQSLLTVLGLWEKREVPVGTFSKGMKQKVAIARALVHDPKVVFLDEPTANLDPESSRTIRDFILNFKDQKKTIFVNTHNLDEAERICDRIGLMKTKLLAVGRPEELRRSLGTRKTAIRLQSLEDKIVRAVKNSGYDMVEIRDDLLIVDVSDPDRENPAIVEAIVAAGGKVRFVTDLSPTLEDAYMTLIRREGS